ncbi:MAG: cell division protein FtsA [Candidatus Saccharibacteria bacterium]
MQETTKYAVGIDIGTTNVRCVVGHINLTTGLPTIVGVGVAPNNGMRKGTVVNLAGPAQAIDDALGEAERMSGYQVDTATISINGSHIFSTHADGMIAVGGANHEIDSDDLIRLEDVSTVGKIPANREILEVVPHSYKLDSQDNIKNPIGMTGTRLEIDAHIVSVLAPHLSNLQKAAEKANVAPRSIVVAGVAAARAVLSEKQIENGVVVIDIGGATTNIAIYEEGDLQYTAVIPIGGINITNDLAIGLKTDPEIAEQLKIDHASAKFNHDSSGVSIRHDEQIYNFDISDMDEIVEARLEELFELINKELLRAGRAGKLPNGAILTGGTAKLKGIADYAKEALGLAVRVGEISDFGGVVDDIREPQFATAIGLMLIDAETNNGFSKNTGKSKTKKSISSGTNKISKFFGRFRI